mmetsp:Transcript_80833/g.233765  ORF Transcript_80833/g.233765 Transcript_80833/m.233765 type:complete len:123 (-) Transcript_80833:3-371(-)
MKIGKNTPAVAHMASAAKVSHAVPARQASLKIAPFKPTNCSVDKFVNISDPATTYHDNALPPAKYSAEALFDLAMDPLVTMSQVRAATAPVQTRKDPICKTIIMMTVDSPGPKGAFRDSAET